MPSLSDMYGRRNFFLAGQAILLIVHGSMLLTRSYNLIIGLCFLAGFFTPLRLIVAFNYLIELMPKKWKVPAGLIYLTIEACMYIYAAIFFHYNKEWRVHFPLTIVFNVVSLTLTFFFLPESPKLLHSQGRIDEAIAALEHIARYNCTKLKLADSASTDSSSNVHEALLSTSDQIETTPPESQ
mmetsp:Transcript_27038/g.31767  ORF Transcript_27038/g.31767 Transcript_27038/m.31767 type:complete len:183 (+) Transcript_27038:96-644(+)